MPNPEKLPKFETDDLSHEAHELFTAYEKEEIKRKEREGRILYEARKAHESILWLLEYGVVSKDMPINDVLGLLDDTIKEINDSYHKKKDEQ